MRTTRKQFPVNWLTSGRLAFTIQRAKARLSVLLDAVKVSFAEIFRRTEVVFIVVLHTVMVQKALFRNSPVR